MTTTTVLALLLAAAGLVAGWWGLREKARALDAAAQSGESRLLATLDLAEMPAAVWLPGEQRVRPNATTKRLMESLDVRCLGDLDHIPARDIATGEPITFADFDRLASSASGRMAIWLGLKDEDRHALEITARPVREGSPLVLLVGHDVTAEHAAIETRSDLVASIAHDMRSALTSTIGYVALVTDDSTLSKRHRHSLDVALKGVNQTLHLMADLRAAREPGDNPVRLSVTPVECDLATILGDALTSLQPEAEEHRVTVSVQAPETVPVVADPLRMRQVIDNLLRNAVKHNDEGGWVDVVLRRSGPDAVMTVSNTGVTLTPEEQERVFERYYRAEASREKGVAGVGLGLSVVRDIMGRHEGTIQISSAPELGTTTLTMTLPMAAYQGSKQASPEMIVPGKAPRKKPRRRPVKRVARPLTSEPVSEPVSESAVDPASNDEPTSEPTTSDTAPSEEVCHAGRPATRADAIAS